MELAAVASFSLAAKMEEVFVPALADEMQVGEGPGRGMEGAGKLLPGPSA